MTPETMGRLANDFKNIVGVKDATGKVERVSEQRLTCGKDFVQLSGEDASALGFNAHGGVGCISVTSNVAPRLCAEFQAATLANDKDKALDLQDRLLERKSPLPIVFITGHGDVPMAVDSMKKGAMDFIQKPFNDEELVSLVERMLEHARGAFTQHQQSAIRDALLSKLTGREAQVLERIVAGRLNKQIADDLGISIKTVEAHRANIMEKLGANTVADLLKIALGQAAAKA